MIREVELVSYLPEFMKNYKESVVALETENQEFHIVWSAVDKILKNRFIETADEYGISHFEQMMKIYPSIDDTLESRRVRIRNKWFNKIPYTMRILLQKLTLLCGSTDFEIYGDFSEQYTLKIIAHLSLSSQVDELDKMLSEIIPENIFIESKNELSRKIIGTTYIAGTTIQSTNIFIASEPEQLARKIVGTVCIAGTAIQSTNVFITSEGEHMLNRSITSFVTD